MMQNVWQWARALRLCQTASLDDVRQAEAEQRAVLEHELRSLRMRGERRKKDRDRNA